MEGTKKTNSFHGDVISRLPDDLICHILSFLSTKEAALTPVLSKRWSNLLQLMPFLDFDDSVLLNPKKGQRRRNGVFEDFVDRLLSLRVETLSPVQRVSLKCRQGGVTPDCIIRWILTIVMDLGVLDLSLRIDFGIFHLPWNVFKSNTLVKLRIGTMIRLAQLPLYLVSPTLKSLVLDLVEFRDGVKVEFKPILLSFPSLQTLQIHESNKWMFWNGSASSRTLKSLIYTSDVDSFASKPCVSFDSPSLVYLEYSDVVADKYENLILDSLVEARLDLHLTATQIMRKPNGIGFVPGDVTTLFKGLRNVKILCLSLDALEDDVYVIICNEGSRGYKGTCQELNQMKRFLGKLQHLQMVRVCHKEVERNRIMKDLFLLPKASSNCEIQVMKETA